MQLMISRRFERPFNTPIHTFADLSRPFPTSRCPSEGFYGNSGFIGQQVVKATGIVGMIVKNKKFPLRGYKMTPQMCSRWKETYNEAHSRKGS